VTEFALPQNRPDKTKSQLKICLLAVICAVMDVMEVIQKLLGNGGKIPVLLPVIFSVTIPGVKLIPFNHVTITLLANMDLAPLSFLPQLVIHHAPQDTKPTILVINISLLQLIQLMATLLLSKLKSIKMAPLKLASTFMKISSHTNPVFINTPLDPYSEDMLSKLWVGELKTELLTG